MLFDSEPRLSRERLTQLERSLAQAERVRESRLEGPDWLLGAMEDHARRLERAERSDAASPASISYFIVPFRRIARSMRREWRRQRGPAAGRRRKAAA